MSSLAASHRAGRARNGQGPEAQALEARRARGGMARGRRSITHVLASILDGVWVRIRSTDPGMDPKFEGYADYPAHAATFTFVEKENPGIDAASAKTEIVKRMKAEGFATNQPWSEADGTHRIKGSHLGPSEPRPLAEVPDVNEEARRLDAAIERVTRKKSGQR